MKLAAAARLLALVALVSFAAVGQQPNPVVDTTADGAFVLGRADAPVTLVEFVDYECAYCRRYHRDVFERLRKEFVDTGLVRYVVRDFPLEMHKNSVTTARAARCGAQQGKFWEMHHALLTAMRQDLEGVVAAARGAGLDPVKLKDCVENAKVNALIKQDREEGLRIGVDTAPAFVIGRSKGDRVEGQILVGSKPYEVYESRIKALLPPNR
jgi:protein-disulfide isomerase